MEEVSWPRRRPRVAPLAPLAVAAVAGVILDRFADPMGTRAWAVAALAFAALAVLSWRRPWMSACAIAASFGALAGGWHHHWWSDLAADDPARAAWAAAEHRPCWARGVVFDGAAFRPGTDGPRDRGLTRFVLALTGWNDGRGWRPASGRVQVAVTGDRSDLEAGRSVEAGRADRPDRGAAQPGRARLPADPPGLAGPAPPERRRADRRSGRPGRPRLALDPPPGRGPGLEPAEARSRPRPRRRPARLGAPAGAARGRRARGQRRLRPDRDDPPPGHLRAPPAGPGGGPGLRGPAARPGAAAGVRGGGAGDVGLCPARRLGPVGGPVGGDDGGRLPGRRPRPLRLGRQPALGRGPGDPALGSRPTFSTSAASFRSWPSRRSSGWSRGFWPGTPPS